MPEEAKPNTGRKLFFGLFIFPLLIAVGMAILLCSVVLLTHETQTADSLIADIKSGSPSKRWQKAFELSNELNRGRQNLRSESLMREIVHILGDRSRYDAKTRGYMALALSHFRHPEAVRALQRSLKDPEEAVRLYALWSLGKSGDRKAASSALPLLRSENPEFRKVAGYVLGILGVTESTDRILVLLDDPVADVRWNAALSLALLGNAAGREVLLQMLDRQVLAESFQMDDRQIESVMINATKGLGLVAGPGEEERLEQISKEDKSLKVRQAAMNALQVIEKQRLGFVRREATGWNELRMESVSA